jgi:Aerotolerance regulator N-terminal/von Willebrand factor type A domain
MSFLFPAFLIGGVAIAIPIVLHLLRRDVAPEVPFSAVHMLRRSPIERSRRRRIRDLLLLLARVAALLLLATAFARPYRAGAAPPARVVIVAIDRSFSMGAPGTFDRARQLAKAAVDEAGAARVAVIAFDERTEVIAPPGSAADARRAIDAVAPGFGATSYASVIGRAAEVAAGDPGRLVVVTDLQRAGWEGDRRAVLPSALELDVKDVAAPSVNVAILQARVQPSTVLVTVRNIVPATYAGQLRLSLDGKDVASAAASVPAGATADVRVPYRAPAAGTLTVTLDDATGLPADNSRILLLDPPARSHVLVVTSGVGAGGGPASSSGFYVARALEAASTDEGAVEPAIMDGAAFSKVGAQALRRYSVVALLSTRSLERRAREGLLSFVRGGGGLIVSAGPEVDASLLAGLLGIEARRTATLVEDRPRVLAVTDLRHPIFRPFGPLTANLGQVRFERSWRMPAEGWNVAAAFTDGAPALLERTEGSGRVLLFTSDLDRRWNDFPLHPAFVPFVLESVRYAAGAAAPGRERTVGDAPAGVEQTPGVHLLPDGRRVVLNVDTRESALSRVTAREFADMLQRVDSSPQRAASLRAQQTEARQSYWQYGLILMLVALIGESVVGRAS